jgi:catechol 2,3-dioxygenase-like lactoylglutathione lyase family enzyme
MATDMQPADGLRDWRVLDAGMSAWFDAPSLPAGAALVARIADVVDGNSLPDVDLRAGGVRVRIGASATLTRDEAELAGAISAAARDLGLAADPAALQTVRLVVDAEDRASLVSFWQTVLGYEPVDADTLGDPLRRDPTVSFRPGRSGPLRDRFHVDVVRTPEAVQAARAVVGSAPFGVYQLTLADADGNEIDLVPGDMLSEGPRTADWRVVFGAMTFYPVGSPVRAGALACAAAGLADEAGLPLLVDLRPDGVTIDSGKDQWEEDFGGTRFVDLAGRIQTAARDLGLSADATGVRFVQLCIDAVDVAAVRAFWTSVLGYRHDPRTFLTDIYDPRRLNPVIMFQPIDPSETARRQHRNRVHVDLVVPHDQAKARAEAAVAAGGRVVADNGSDRRILLDPEGNELTIGPR